MDDDIYMHLRGLKLLDELHRVGFEQLRFDRSLEGQHVRLQIYPAQLSRENYGIQFEISQQFLVSDTAIYLLGMPCAERGLEQKWQELLAGNMAPKHLAGQWILDFPDFARLGYGPDHAYREWFRTLRPYLTSGYLPVTWAENNYGGKSAFDHFVALWRAGDESPYIPRPPANPFA